jgi:DeoR/GlpR family transcriptional regulator of sugar metabolism
VSNVADEAPGSRKVTPGERRAQIVELSRQGGFLTTRELADRLQVSEMTVRRDVAYLAERGRIRSVFGGAATAGEELAGGTDFQERARTNTAVKIQIGRAATELIRPGSLIALDNGTTTIEMARSLSASSELSVVTTSLPVINILNERANVEVTSLGGVLQPELQAFAGPLALANVEQLHVAQFFLSASAVRPSGVFCANQYDSMTKRALIRSSDEVILLADSSKFNLVTAMMKVAALEQIDVLITDDGLSSESIAMLDDTNIRVVSVSSLGTQR